MNNIKPGDRVEGINSLGREYVCKFGDLVVSISEDGYWLRLEGRPDNGCKMSLFKVKDHAIQENE